MVISNVLSQAAVISKATEAVNNILSISGNIHKSLASQCKVEGHELIVSCQDGIQRNTMVLDVGHKFINGKLNVKIGRTGPQRIHLVSMYGEDYTDAITKTDTGFVINTKDIAGDGLYSLRFDHPIDTEKFIDAFVDIRKAKESPGDEKNEYWMHAELKCPEVLKMKYNRVEIQNIDFTVNVGVSSDIKSIIPQTFENELADSLAVLREKNPHEITKRAMKLAYTKRERGNKKDDVITVLSSLQRMFEARNFGHYISVEKDFMYFNCYRGMENYGNVPYPTWPLSMSVISRTDLDLNKCAADGTVIYKKKDFLEEIRKIVNK